MQKIHKQYKDIQKQRKKKAGPKVSSIALEYFDQCSYLANIDEAPAEVFPETWSDHMGLVLGKPNEVNKTFIDAYKSHPLLYDPKTHNHSSYADRKEAIRAIASTIRLQYNFEFTEEDVNKSIHGMRHWYFKALERKHAGEELSSVQKFYVDRCSFLPPRPLKRKFPCEICGKILFNEQTLQGHMYKEHQTGELPFKCPDCYRSFEKKTSLQTHQQRTHVGKVYSCQYCGRAFAVLIDMQRHESTHTGEKKYVCEICGKAFRIKTQLGYHMTAIHTKIRAFKCHLCPKDFKKRGDLKDHIKAHLNIRDKICATCGKGFTNCHSLIRHRQIHSEVKKFECKLCDSKFHQFVGLNAHMKRTHNIVKNKQQA